jgi:hypothetical protein
MLIRERGTGNREQGTGERIIFFSFFFFFLLYFS